MDVVLAVFSTTVAKQSNVIFANTHRLTGTPFVVCSFGFIWFSDEPEVSTTESRSWLVVLRNLMITFGHGTRRNLLI